MTSVFVQPFNKYIFNLPTSTQLLFSASGRECGKALTLPLKLVMETCSWGQRMDWAWQPISSRKAFSCGAKAGCTTACDPACLSDGGKALGWWSIWVPLVSVKTPQWYPTLNIQQTTLKPSACHGEGMKNSDLRLEMFFGQKTGLLMPPVVSITPRSTMLYKTKSR